MTAGARDGTDPKLQDLHNTGQQQDNQESPSQAPVPTAQQKPEAPDQTNDSCNEHLQEKGIYVFTEG